MIMIDKYKREKAARQISEKVADANGFDDSKPTHIAFLEGHVDGFNAGAKWMQEEFLKDLWHPASEKPKEFNHYGFAALYVLQYNHQIRMVLYNKGNMSWKNVISINEYWLYVDDLLPKKGGNHD